MQAIASVQKPFVASGPARAAHSSSSRGPVVVRAAAVEPLVAARLSRRSLASLLAAAPALLMPGAALALIPDDDDEELVEKARANRKAKLASEKATEQAFSRSSDRLDRVLEQELIPVQRAINTLAQSGALLESGDIKAAASTLNGSWVGDFKAAAEKLSYTDEAKSTAAVVFTSLSALGASAAKGSAPDAKRGFVSAVLALQSWAAAAGVDSAVKGL